MNESTPHSTTSGGDGSRWKRAKSSSTSVEKEDDASSAFGRSSIQDRLLTKVLEQVFPTEAIEDESSSSSGEQQNHRHIRRPGFSIALMTTNFRRFNARIGVVFVFQYRLIRLLTWHRPTQTLSFLGIYTLLILSPGLLPVLPLALFLICVMIPAFIHRHPPPPSSVSESYPNLDPIAVHYSLHGPALAPPATVKPVSETSKDFFRNMRDLQNSMGDFSAAHDQIVKHLSPPTNFSDESLSSFIFICLLFIVAIIFLASDFIFWRPILLFAVWVPLIATHPSIQPHLCPASPTTHSLTDKSSSMTARLKNFIINDILPPSTPEVREVEIFELQRRRAAASASSNKDSDWEPWLYSPSPYDPLSPSRIAGSRPQGTSFFEDVQAPQGWAWESKKWDLDLGSQEWVEERMIAGVEVETEGGRWVSDLKSADSEMEELVGLQEENGNREKGKKRSKDWEESRKGLALLGRWRRRRWIRSVKRVATDFE